MTRKPKRRVAEAGLPLGLPELVALVDVDAAVVEEDVAVGELGLRRGDVPAVEDMATWEQRVPLRGRTGRSSAP